MTWTDIFWTTYRLVVNTAVDAAANTLQTVGSLACTAGGMGFALSYAVDDSVTASYYGAAHTTGFVRFDLDIPEYKFHVNGTVPFHHNLQKDGSFAYHLNEYINPATVVSASAVLAVSGTVLRVVGAYIKLWQQGQKDAAFSINKTGLPLTAPGIYECLSVGAEALSGSITYTALPCAVTGVTLHYTGLIGLKKMLSYPPEGGAWVSSTHYNGPVASAQIPLELIIQHNTTMDMPFINMDVAVEERVDAKAVANATYGGGLFFKSNESPELPFVAPTVAGIGSYLSSMFFSQKALRYRDERVGDEQLEGYLEV